MIRCISCGPCHHSSSGGVAGPSQIQINDPSPTVSRPGLKYAPPRVQIQAQIQDFGQGT